MQKQHIGFIGQGWIGKNYADDFERRGYGVTRYAQEREYAGNREKVRDCDIVFIAVPTPTRNQKFDDSIVREVVKLVGKGKIAVIKSTVIPGTTESIQKENPGIFVFHSPEFLTESTARQDASQPFRNIIGISEESDEYRQKAKEVLSVLPKAQFDLVCKAKEAELIKYGGNNWFYFKVIYINLLYDLANKIGCDWEVIRDAMIADPRIGTSHMNPVHKSGTLGGEAERTLPLYELHMEPVHKSGRGAGGHCFIKDFAAFSEIYKKEIDDPFGHMVLDALKNKNIDLLVSSNKDLDLLRGVYGDTILNSANDDVS
ncbi:MAG: hypothetical protein HYT93_01520 [Parcubacteria group bacterium]|nr:hypothetical protein [Parcubacteria group bacterium]